MDRASRRLGGWTALAVAGGATMWWWQASPSHFADRTDPDVTVVGGHARSLPATDPVVVAPVPIASATPRAADPVVAARRDVPVLAAVAARGDGDSKVLDGAMTRQGRNAATAAPTEQAMQRALMAVPALAGGSQAPRVLCVDTTCEVTGIAAAGRAPAEVEEALRDPALLRAVVARGYMPGPVTVAAAPGGGVGYVLYLNDEMGNRVAMAR